MKRGQRIIAVSVSPLALILHSEGKLMRPGMNVIELGCFMLCCLAAFLIGAPLGLKFGVAGWILGVPLGFFGGFGFFQGLLWLVCTIYEMFSRRRHAARSDRSDKPSCD